MEESRTHFSALKGEGRICYDSSMMDRKRERERGRKRERGGKRERESYFEYVHVPGFGNNVAVTFMPNKSFLY